nr:kinesin-like protein KIF11-B [Leptinotarsa decemlineata]
MSGILHPKKKQTQPLQNVKVVVRIRPVTKQEEDQNVKSILKCPTHKELYMKEKKYTFDRVFKPTASQIELYLNVVFPLIKDVVAGYNCTVFAYGQTGTGKTYTMTGEKCNLIGNWNEDKDAGIIPRAAFHIYDELNKMSNVEMNVKVSYIELYNEEIRDLLSEDENTLQMYSDNKGNVSIQGLTEVSAHDSEGICKLLQRGIVKRQIAPTLMNHQSSRSHTVFTISINTRESTPTGDDILKAGKINLVDLAGSENIARSGCKDLRAMELANINRSLLTLGRVIHALVDKNQKHVPYRDSKLTRILQDSLGGHTKTVIIATISPAHTSHEETTSTLEYATRARDIKNTPIINEKLTKHEMIDGLVKEIDRLQKDLDAARSGTGFYVDKENYQRMIDAITAVTGEQITPEELASKKAERISNLKEYMEAKVRQFEETVELCKRHEEELDKAKAAIKEKDETLEQERFLAKWYESQSSEKFNEAQNLLKTTKLLNKEKEILLAKLEHQFNINLSNETVLQNAVRTVINMINKFEEEESSKMKASEQNMQMQFTENLLKLKDEFKNHTQTIKNGSGTLSKEIAKNNFSVQKSVEEQSKEYIQVVKSKAALLGDVLFQYSRQLQIFKSSVPKLAEGYRSKTEEYFKNATEMLKASDDTMKTEIVDANSKTRNELDELQRTIEKRKLEDEKNLRELESMVLITKNRIEEDCIILDQIRKIKENVSVVEERTNVHTLMKIKELERLTMDSIKSFEDCVQLVPNVEEIQGDQINALLSAINDLEMKLNETCVNLDNKYQNISHQTLEYFDKHLASTCQQIESSLDSEVNIIISNIDTVVGITQRFIDSYYVFAKNMKQVVEEQIVGKNVSARHAGDTPIRQSMSYPSKIQNPTPREALIEKFKQSTLQAMDEEWNEL